MRSLKCLRLSSSFLGDSSERRRSNSCRSLSSFASEDLVEEFASVEDDLAAEEFVDLSLVDLADLSLLAAGLVEDVRVGWSSQ